jgi:hypothetical protein
LAIPGKGATRRARRERSARMNARQCRRDAAAGVTRMGRDAFGGSVARQSPAAR